MLSKSLKNAVLDLKSMEKVQLVDILLSSLDKDDPQFEKAWEVEAKLRYKAYREGKISASMFFNEIDKIR